MSLEIAKNSMNWLKWMMTWHTHKEINKYFIRKQIVWKKIDTNS